MAITPEDKDKMKRQLYQDMKEYQSKFLLTPEIDDTANYSHLDKNLAITNLKHNPKLKIDEPGEARAILKGLHILNNEAHFETIEVEQFAGYKEEPREDGGLDRIPVFVKVKKEVSLFPKMYHNRKSEFISMVNTSAARNGHRIDKAISNKLVREETLHDKTKVNRGFNFGRGNNER